MEQKLLLCNLDGYRLYDKPDERNFNLRLANALVAAQQRFEYAETLPDSEALPHFITAYSHLRPFGAQPVGLRQRMQLNHMIAKVFTREGDFGYALACTQAAFEDALRLDDRASQVKLLRQSGHIQFLALHLTDAFADYEQSNQIHSTLQVEAGPSVQLDPALQLNTYMRLGSLATELGLPSPAHQWIDKACKLRTLILVQNDWLWGSIDLVQALIFQREGELSAATILGRQARDMLPTGMSQAYGRASVNLAVITLDVLDKLLDDLGSAVALGSHAYTDTLESAHSFLADALPRLPESDDAVGYGLVKLTTARWLVARGRPLEARMLLHPVIALARQVNDAALLGCAWTEMAYVLEALGEIDSARNLYHQVLRILNEHDLRGEALRPQRRLARLDQQP